MEIEQVDQATIPPRAFMRQFQLTPWRIVDFPDPSPEYAISIAGQPVEHRIDPGSIIRERDGHAVWKSHTCGLGSGKSTMRHGVNWNWRMKARGGWWPGRPAQSPYWRQPASRTAAAPAHWCGRAGLQ